ncbi:MAG: hypothetical protein QG657_802 [Acidobacteriota bacterium]|nr:hypothetical protein [Acidobacteriota bacterium]
MPKEHEIDIILPTRNRPQYLEECLKYIRKQTYTHWNLIIIDGGDVSRTRAITSSLIPLSRLKLIELKAPSHLEGEQRIANARNVGMAAGKAGYNAHIDDDNIFLPTHIEKLMAVMCKAGDVEFAYADSLRIDNKGKATPFQAGGPYSLERLLVENFIASDDAMHSRRLFELVGPIREDLAFYADWEYWVRLALHTKVAHVPEVLTIYREHACQASCEYSREKHKLEFVKVRDIVNQLALVKYMFIDKDVTGI